MNLEVYEASGIRYVGRKREGAEDHCADSWIANTTEQEYRLSQMENVEYVLDIGSHIGTFALYALTNYPEWKIVGVEPHPDNFSLTEMNLLSFSNHDAVYGYVGYEENLYLMSSKYSSASHFMTSQHTGTEQEFTMSEDQPKKYTVEDLLAMFEYPRFDALKIDCEGGEFDIIANISDEVLAQISYISGEHHSNLEVFEDIIAKRLISAGFAMEYTQRDYDRGLFFAKNTLRQNR